MSATPTPSYPVTPLLPDIQAALATHTRLVLEAPPGAGKTTQVPPALLNAPWCRGRVIMLEPRRIAARAAAMFMAGQFGEDVGDTVGYRIRFDTRVSAGTRIEVVTEGILTRMLQQDPSLEGVSAVVFDEFHERNLASDLGLALCLDVQQSLRPELRLIVMSATLDGARLTRFLDAMEITSPGRSHPVQITYQTPRTDEPVQASMVRAVRQALDAYSGDILCFLPGRYEIDRCADMLQSLPCEVLPLHGELPVEQQVRVLRPGEQRRVILSTNVAESSVTVAGVRTVIDSGLAREPRFDPISGMSRLETVSISQASADQRAGRAGREASGQCIRLWSESRTLDRSARPEIAQVELSGLLLELKTWGSEDLQFLDPPPPGALAQARDLLTDLDAISPDGRITAHGRALQRLGASPRLANAILRAPAAQQRLACDVAAILEQRDPLRGNLRRDDDFELRLKALQALRDKRPLESDVSRGDLYRIDQTARAWADRLKLPRHETSTMDSHDLGTLVALAYPDRIARQENDNPRRYLLANGRGATLAAASSLVGERWLAISDLRFEARDSLVQRAARLDEEALREHFPSHFTAGEERVFNATTRAVEAHAVESFGHIALTRRRIATPADDRTLAMLLEAVGTLGLESLPWSEALRNWQSRVGCLRGWCPELELPEVSDDALLATREDWLAPLLAGHTRLNIDAERFAATVRSMLNYPQRQLVDELAPTEYAVPSGMRRKLVYAAGEPPVLAVKLQEMFGQKDTPRIARGRVPLVLHLLSPRQTPIQVTQDLAGFWERTYPEVRKELQGRYPKHPWPEDPWSATPTHKTKRQLR
ncbi:MAG: ATP-dependent helicase HrpB [Gammaproteobacteria bacterium]|nr:ATP-dependent helicase HrpB [Gammaproteobacteria bacterium]